MHHRQIGRHRCKTSGYDVRASIHEAKEQVTFIAAANHHEVEIRVETPKRSVSFYHDRILLTRATTNLLKNAVEAGASRIGISLDQSSDGVSIKVNDNGPGLSDSDVSLFLSGRGRSSKRDRFAVGLSTVNHIIRSHGGKIFYRKSPGGGAGFEIRLFNNARGSVTENREVALHG